MMINKKIIGYSGSPDDCGTFMHTKKEDAFLKFSNVYDSGVINIDYKLGRIKKDFMQTYDGYDIVSEDFANFCKEEHYDNIEFVQLPNNSNFYWFKVHSILPFDAERRQTRFLNYSEKYQSYEEIIGAYPAFLKIRTDIDKGIFRTDICFGTGISKGPVLCFGKQTKEKIEIKKFRGFNFEEIID